MENSLPISAYNQQQILVKERGMFIQGTSLERGQLMWRDIHLENIWKMQLFDEWVNPSHIDLRPVFYVQQRSSKPDSTKRFEKKMRGITVKGY